MIRNEKADEPYRALIVDDSAVVRRSLAQLVDGHASLEVVGTAEDGAEAIERVANLSPDVVLMDVQMPGMNGLEATRAIRRRHRDIRIVIVTFQKSRRLGAACRDAGAHGYVSKTAGARAILDEVERVLAESRSA